jgi:hypothetical protein
LRTSDLVKWNRAVNEIRYKHNELELIKELSSDIASRFNHDVKQYCEKNDIDIAALEKSRGLSNSVKQGKANREQEEINEEAEGTLTETEEHFMGEITETHQPIEKDVDEMKEIFKRLFKKLAIHLHPDRVMNLSEQEREDRLEMFKEAKDALDNERYFYLLDLSERFRIRMPNNYKQQTRWMKDRIKQLDQEIDLQKSSYNYVYSECETQAEKDKIIFLFLKQLYGV